eukprot:gene19189-19562_t
MYGNKANYLSPFEESSKKKSDAAAANAVPVTVKGGMGRGPLPISRESSGKPFQIKVSRDGIYRKYDSKENEKEEDEKNDDEIDAMVQSLLRKQRKADAPASEGEQRHKPQEIIRKISAMNKAKTDLIDRTLTDLLKNTQQQKPPEGGSSNGRPSSAPAARRREAPSAKSDRTTVQLVAEKGQAHGAHVGVFHGAFMAEARSLKVNSFLQWLIEQLTGLSVR